MTRFWTLAVFGTALLAGAALLTGLAACAPAPAVPGASSQGASSQATPLEGTTMSPSDSQPPSHSQPTSGRPAPVGNGTDLSITVTPSAGAQPHTFRFTAAHGSPGPESTVPDPAAALAALDRFGEKIFFPVPGPPQQCTDQYGGPQVAVVTGWFAGRAVTAAFKRTDGCQIARWQALAPLFGAAAGGTGAV